MILLCFVRPSLAEGFIACDGYPPEGKGGGGEERAGGESRTH
jgi:hypothetical protein